jgi:hypothetical protein
MKLARKSLRCASAAERAAHDQKVMEELPVDCMPPLYGYLTMNGVECVVEYLPRDKQEDPGFMVMAPDDYHFGKAQYNDTNEFHALACGALNDVLALSLMVNLERCCEPECICLPLVAAKAAN